MKYGSVMTGIYASDTSFKNYASGVYDKCHNMIDAPKGDHSVVVVGWGDDPEFGKYWVIKNSWGTGYGHKGYVYVARGNFYMLTEILPVSDHAFAA